MAKVVRRRDLDFLLFEWLDVLALCGRARFEDHDRASFDAVLDLAERIADEVLWPVAAKSDAEEPWVSNGIVRVIEPVGKALDAIKSAGFFSAPCGYEEGGMQLPITVFHACTSQFKGADVGTTAYFMLSRAAANLLAAHASTEQKRLYMRPLNAGRFFGTMCLSEPDAGSSLADIRTRAEPVGGGVYRITGSKMWISGGEHELAENIVHLVLAKTPRAPPGVKGISLFIVPKRRLEEDGEPGVSNNISLVGLNHKMGYRGCTNCLLAFGERGETLGYLVGEEHQGLVYMFHMMNEARIGVGIGATTLGYAGYLASLQYAKERRQGRPLGAKSPDAPAVPIIEHPDVSRMLLQQKAYVEGALALCLYCGRLVDDLRTSETAEERARVGLLLDVLTPIAKAWPSEFCLEANKLAIQVLGGYGYTREFPVERLYRDNRLNAIHEGTNGIQALDLLGRKVILQDGEGLRVLVRSMRETIASATRREELAGYASSLDDIAGLVERVTDAAHTPPPDGQAARGLANATPYLHGLGHVVVAWLWLAQAEVAQTALAGAQAEEDRRFYRGKLSACRYFFHYELPHARANLELVGRLDATCIEIDPAEF